jgi:ABC-2 type transport system permease protein
MGVIPLSSLVYFGALTALMLYLNLVMMTRRHWSSARRAGMGAQYAARLVSLGVILICVTVWAGYAALRVDATSERLFTLSPVTKQMLRQLDAERPIEIQAFLSPEVPREYVETRKRLVGLLRQFDELSGRNLEVRYVDVAPFSKEAEEAEHFGIEPMEVITEVDGRRSEAEVYLGAVVVSSYDKVVVPFFGKGLPIEYELTRSVQTVSQKERHSVGVLLTDARLMGGGREWRIVTELKKQYEVEEVSPDSPIDTDKFDVLLAAMPSSLTDPQMDNLVAYVKSGKPVLIFDDPFPLTFNSGMGVTNAPKQPKPNPGGQMGMMGGSPPPEPKADNGQATRLLEALDLRWQYDRVAFDLNNPHPEFGMLPAEYIFVTRDAGNDNAFNNESAITRDLQELIMLYAGTVEDRGTRQETEFVPLLNTSFDSGLLDWSDFVDESGFNFFSMQMTAMPKRNPPRAVRRDERSHTLAAHVKSDKQDGKVNAVFVADIDMISDFFFEERNLGRLDIEFDNVTFVLNAVDALAGDEGFIELRSRRPRHRTLTRFEARKRVFLEDANQAEREADKEADEELAKRRQVLTERVKEIEDDENLDPIAKAQLLEQARQAEQQRMNLAEAQIEQRKNTDIRKIRARTNQQEKGLEAFTRLWAVGLPPIPPLLLGLIIFFRRWSAEQRNVVRSRRRDM